MTLFLVAHKVRGEAAFDIASQLPCAICHADPEVVNFTVPSTEDCHECEGVGYWWIIPTSGHRAYPYWYHELGSIINEFGPWIPEHGESYIIAMPPDLRDHYAANNRSYRSDPDLHTDDKAASSLLASLGIELKPKEPIRRRV